MAVIVPSVLGFLRFWLSILISQECSHQLKCNVKFPRIQEFSARWSNVISCDAQLCFLSRWSTAQTDSGLICLRSQEQNKVEDTEHD
jgi:hypothetical protein